MFNTPISCGAFAGICAGVIWVLMIGSLINSPPQTMSQLYLENTLRAALCLGAVLCGVPLYFRRFSILKGALGWTVLLWLGAYASMSLSSKLADWILPSTNLKMWWNVRELVYIIILCPFLGGLTGFCLSRLYDVPQLSWRATGFGVLGCAVHFVSGISFSLIRLLNVEVATKDMMALNVMCAVLGYVFLGAITAIPFDQYARMDQEVRAAMEVASD